MKKSKPEVITTLSSTYGAINALREIRDIILATGVIAKIEELMSFCFL